MEAKLVCTPIVGGLHDGGGDMNAKSEQLASKQPSKTHPHLVNASGFPFHQEHQKRDSKGMTTNEHDILQAVIKKGL